MMTEEKEIAEKVWELLGKQLLSASRTFDKTRKDYHEGSRDYLATTMDELEKILPRPKRKVKEERWINIGRDITDDELFIQSGALYSTKEEAEREVEETVATVRVTFEVEE